MKTYDFKRMEKSDMILEDDGIRIYDIKDRFDLKTDSVAPDIIRVEFTHETEKNQADEYRAFMYYGFDEIGTEIGSFAIRRGETINAMDAISIDCRHFKNGGAVITLEDPEGKEFRVKFPKAAYEAHTLVM